MYIRAFAGVCRRYALRLSIRYRTGEDMFEHANRGAMRSPRDGGRCLSRFPAARSGALARPSEAAQKGWWNPSCAIRRAPPWPEYDAGVHPMNFRRTQAAMILSDSNVPLIDQLGLAVGAMAGSMVRAEGDVRDVAIELETLLPEGVAVRRGRGSTQAMKQPL